MKVILTVSRSGPGGSYDAGDEFETSEAEGARLIEAGQATPIAESNPKHKRAKADLNPKETRGKR